MIVDSDRNDFVMVCKRTVFFFPIADSYDLIQKQGPVVDESVQEGPPSYDDATENGPCSERFSFTLLELCSPFISFFPKRCWETETRRVNCSTDAYTPSLTGTSKHDSAIVYAFSYGLQLCIAGPITHNSAVIHTFSYSLQLRKPSVWRASRISTAPGPPRDDLSPIWIACSPYSFWFAR